MTEELISTDEAAHRLGITTRRVCMLIDEGKLPATRFGKSWAIRPQDLQLVAIRKRGRPRKIDPGEQELPL